ncbi:MAG: hypothetical protein KQH67_06720 [Bacteroidetes bacterium]|nr:hypothetical protein [Bacteroidota bacterium]
MLIIIVFLFVFQACKKDEPDPNPTPQESVLDYFPLTVGNYWIYQNYNCDSGEVNCTTSTIDTNYVTKDTLIDGKKYFKINGNRIFWDEPRYLRDSGAYIVDSNGKIIFTIKEGDDTYNHINVINEGDTAFYWYNYLFENSENISVEAGSFKCFDFRLALFRNNDDFQTEYNTHNYFSKNVGPVKETAMFVSNLQVTKRELVGYSIQPPMIP